MIAPVMLSTR